VLSGNGNTGNKRALAGRGCVTRAGNLSARKGDKMSHFDWPYLWLDCEGNLRFEDGSDLLYAEDGSVPTFESTQQAEDYLREHDIRGSVR
jgi:hypothetical protein